MVSSKENLVRFTCIDSAKESDLPVAPNAEFHPHFCLIYNSYKGNTPPLVDAFRQPNLVCHIGETPVSFTLSVMAVSIFSRVFFVASIITTCLWEALGRCWRCPYTVIIRQAAVPAGETLFVFFWGAGDDAPRVNALDRIAIYKIGQVHLFHRDAQKDAQVRLPLRILSDTDPDDTGQLPKALGMSLQDDFNGFFGHGALLLFVIHGTILRLGGGLAAALEKYFKE
jgi:hypothetical protein